jgi:hypothetical protein
MNHLPVARAPPAFELRFRSLVLRGTGLMTRLVTCQFTAILEAQQKGQPAQFESLILHKQYSIIDEKGRWWFE